VPIRNCGRKLKLFSPATKIQTAFLRLKQFVRSRRRRKESGARLGVIVRPENSANPIAGKLPAKVRFDAIFNPTPAVTWKLVPAEGDQYLALTFDRRATGQGLRYILEGSFDLSNWNTISVTEPGLPASVTVRHAFAVGSKAAHFLRVRLQSQ
jgi:hypothetical protein